MAGLGRRPARTGARAPRPGGGLSSAPPPRVGQRTEPKWIIAVKTHPVMAFILLLATIISAIQAILWGADKLTGTYRSHFNWRSMEYARLRELHIGQTLEHFIDKLGNPEIEEALPARDLVERDFHGRDYWVQTITHRDSRQVVQIVITACSPQFQPTFENGHQIVLGRTRLSDVTDRPDGSIYNFPGSNPPEITEWFATSHVDEYIQYTYGLSRTCGPGMPTEAFKRPSDYHALIACGSFKACDRRDHVGLLWFRAHIIVNAWGECDATQGSSYSNAGECPASFGTDHLAVARLSGPGPGP